MKCLCLNKTDGNTNGQLNINCLPAFGTTDFRIRIIKATYGLMDQKVCESYGTYEAPLIKPCDEVVTATEIVKKQ